jgi:hypothetical protein
LFYLPYLLTSGSHVLGYLPQYLQETFNLSPLGYTLNYYILQSTRSSLPEIPTLLSLGIIAGLAVWAIFHPASDAEAALRRCLWPMGAFTLLSQNLYPWYLLWLLPLVAIFLETSLIRGGTMRLPRLDAWTGWWLFCGLVALSYFPRDLGVPFAVLVIGVLLEFLPLYIFLALGSFPWKKIHSLLGKRRPAIH